MRLRPSRPGHYAALLALLALTAVKGWLWAASFPPLQPSDEIHHLGYARDIAAQRTVNIQARDIFAPEEVIALDVARIVQVSGFRRPLDLSPDRVNEIAHAQALLRMPALWPPAEPSPWVHFFSRYHPPFYYALGALAQRLVLPPDLFAHLALGRLLSVGMTVVTVLLSYLLARELFPLRPFLWLTVAAITSFLPMATYIGAMYTNQALEIALFALIFYLASRIVRRGLSWPLAITTGLALAVGLLTKVSFLIALPLLGLVALYETIRRSRLTAPWIVLFLLPTIIAGPWYWNYFQIGGGGLADRRAEAAVCGPFLSYLFTLPIRRLLFQYWSESVASFGHRDSLLSWPLYQTVLIAVVFAFVGFGKRVWLTLTADRKQKSSPLSSEQGFMLVFMVAAWVGVYLFYFLVGYLISCDQRAEYTQGRQATSVAVGFALFITVGWASLSRRYSRWIMIAAVALLLGLHHYAFIYHVVQRYYGSQQILAIEERDILSDPIVAGHALRQCFSSPEPLALNRVDLWLTWERGVRAGELALFVSDKQGQVILQTEVDSLGWGAVYPAYFRFRPISLEGLFCLEFHGDFATTARALGGGEISGSALSGDSFWFDGGTKRPGSLSLLLYQPADWREWPARMAVQSPTLYTPGFYSLLGAVYLVLLVIFLGFYGRAATIPHSVAGDVTEQAAQVGRETNLNVLPERQSSDDVN